MLRYLLPVSFACALTGCVDETITFRAEAAVAAEDGQESQPAEPSAATVRADGGEASAPPTEFDLGAPRSSASGSRSPGEPFTGGASTCDGAVCSCQSNFDCPVMAPSCDPLSRICVQCFSDQDCVLRFDVNRPVCDEGECRGCEGDFDCPAGWDCRSGSCLESCNGNRDCSLGWFCQDGVCTAEELLPP